MTTATLSFLEENKHFKEIYSQELIARTMNMRERVRMEKIIHEEFEPGFTADLWCEPCVREMILKAYKHYEERK